MIKGRRRKMPKAVQGVPPEKLAELFLEKSVAKAVFGLKRLEGKAFHALLTSCDQLEGFDPLFPLMPSNGARGVSRLTCVEPLSEPVVVFLRPCEIRALIELVKLNQAHLDNLIIVGIECTGVARNQEAFIQQKDLSEGFELREACKGCEHPYPENTDFVISYVGRSEPVIILKTEKAEDIAKGLGLSISDVPEMSDEFKRIAEEKRAYSEKLISEIKEKARGIDGLLEVFGRCIGCHNCSHVCPICYCKDCFFESATFDYDAESYENRLNKKETYRVPLDTVLFHIGRMTHMATSCVACGMCEDACPMDIPVSQVFKAVGRDVQALFEYVPGRSVEEELPLTTFRYDELHEVEDR